MNSAAYMTGIGAGGQPAVEQSGDGKNGPGRAFDGPSVCRRSNDHARRDRADLPGAGPVATTSQPFRVTLAYSDAPGPTTGAPFVNNLDLEVTIGGQTYRGNVFSGANSTTAAAGPEEQRRIGLPAGGHVGQFHRDRRAANIAGDGVPGNAGHDRSGLRAGHL